MTSNELVGRTWKAVHMSKPHISCSEATSLDTVSFEGSDNNDSKIVVDYCFVNILISTSYRFFKLTPDVLKKWSKGHYSI